MPLHAIILCCATSSAAKYSLTLQFKQTLHNLN